MQRVVAGNVKYSSYLAKVINSQQTPRGHTSKERFGKFRNQKSTGSCRTTRKDTGQEPQKLAPSGPHLNNIGIP